MTAEVFGPSSVSTWFPESGAARIAIAPKADEELQTPGTLSRGLGYARRVAELLRVIEVARRAPYVQPAAVVALIDWLVSLPNRLPESFIAVGDDGSISAEWDVGGNSFHATFYNEANEVYVYSPITGSWEGSVAATSVVSAALRDIARAALG